MEIENFDASNIPPQQMGDKHPEGHFPFKITNTRGKPTKDNSGGIFEVTFTSPAGSIVNNYNLWNASTQAVEIAQKELSALCHATGVFKLTMKAEDLANAGFELRGAEGTMLVGPQANNPQYMEVKKVFDRSGNEPGKPPGSAPAPQGSGWGGQTQQPTQQPAQWGGASNPAPAAAPANNPPAGWSPGPTTNAAPAATANKPPWAT